MQPNPSIQAFDLGECKAVFGPNRANARIILYVMPVFILAGLVLIFRIPVAGILMLLIAAGLFWGYRAQLRAKAEVFEKGIRATDWLGRSQSFRWEDVSEVYEAIGYHQRTGRPNQWIYTVHLKDGRQVKLNMAYEKIRSLGITLLTETHKILLPAALEAYRAGQTVFFGPQIKVNSQGFDSNNRPIAWEQVGRAVINGEGDFILYKRGQRLPWKRLWHARVANFPTFRAFLHEVVQGTIAELALEDQPLERVQELRQDVPRANIGTVSTAIGYDVRELLMEGFTMKEIHRVVRGEISLAQLRQEGPKKKRKQHPSNTTSLEEK
jgi:hypothetical protein